MDLLAVQGTLRSLLQHHSSKASILQHSAFFTVQLSHPYMTTGKTIALTRWNFVGKVTSLLLNMLSRLVITFLPRSKRLLISCLQSPSAVFLEPEKIKPDTVSTVRLFPLVAVWTSSKRAYAIRRSAAPKPLPLRQSTADLFLHRRRSNTVLSQALWGLWVLVCTRFV